MNSEWQKPLKEFLVMCVDHGTDRRCDSEYSTPEVVARLKDRIQLLATTDNQGNFHELLHPRRAVYYGINLLINRGEKTLVDEILKELGYFSD